MQHQPAKDKEDDNAAKEDPFVLTCSSLHHADSVAADAQSVSHTVQSLLRILQHLPLLAQIPQDSLTAGNVLVQGRVRVGEEALFPKGMRFPHFVGRTRRQMAASGLRRMLVSRLKRRIGDRR